MCGWCFVEFVYIFPILLLWPRYRNYMFCAIELLGFHLYTGLIYGSLLHLAPFWDPVFCYETSCFASLLYRFTEHFQVIIFPVFVPCAHLFRFVCIQSLWRPDEHDSNILIVSRKWQPNQLASRLSPDSNQWTEIILNPFSSETPVDRNC